MADGPSPLGCRPFHRRSTTENRTVHFNRLRIYASAIDGEIFHYHDRNDLEADAIIQFHDGRWGAVEIKLDSRSIDEAANNLQKLKNKIDAEKMQEPSLLLVLTGGEFAYRRDDGVYVVPIGCLKP